MSKKAAAYIAGGAGSQSSVTNNRTSFEKYHIVPRLLRNVSIRDTSIELFGKKFSSPLILSPVGVLEMVHKQADIAVGKAPALENVPYIFIFSNQITGSLLMGEMA